MNNINIISKTKAKKLEQQKKALFSNQIVYEGEQAYRVFSIKGKNTFYAYPITQTEAFGITNNKGILK